MSCKNNKRTNPLHPAPPHRPPPTLLSQLPDNSGADIAEDHSDDLSIWR